VVTAVGGALALSSSLCGTCIFLLSERWARRRRLLIKPTHTAVRISFE